MKSLLTAITFLTRIPAGKSVVCDGADVAKSAGWFPLVGLVLGLILWLAAALLRGHLPPPLIAVIMVILDVLLTGALHYDGLADSADGFGGGRVSEDVLRIMRDHAIGSYGGLALVSIVALKVTAYAMLLRTNNWIPALVLTPALGRWSILILSAALPYARPSSSVVDGMGRLSLLLGTVVIAAALTIVRSGRGIIAAGVVVAVTAVFGYYCRRRIGGITGDTLGASVQLCESAALLTFLWTNVSQ